MKHPIAMPSPLPASSLEEYYSAGFSKARQTFEASRDGRTAILERSALADAVIAQLYRDVIAADLNEPKNFCLLALGGYGRRELFPYSDIDLLFLSEDARALASRKEEIAALLRALWDLRLRVGHTARSLAECGQFHPHNLEFNVSLLDCRYLAGDERLFERLEEAVIPHFVARDFQDLVNNLVEMTRRRHAKHGQTIFHLEPNLKEAPGGLRDYHVARWLTEIVELEKGARRVSPEAIWPSALATESVRAFEFFMAARCFVHFYRGRDDNQMTYELQDLAASSHIGHPSGEPLATAEWMRTYFRFARSIHRLTAQVIDESLPGRSSLYHLLQDWKSRLSNADFSVMRGRIFVRQPAAVQDDPGLLLRLFEFMDRHALDLTREAERWVEASLPRIALLAPSYPGLWGCFRQILVLPRAAQTLRVMHRLGLLDTLFPEFRAIDSLVVRDFYHRYTVDEHTFTAIQSLHALRGAESGGEHRFSEILLELEQPELLFLALLFHDVGKGIEGVDHVEASLRALEGVFARLALELEDRETVRFLVASHLEMSATLQRRDVFDAETVHAFADKVGTTERLKLLCLLTYADIKAVNPEALTPWKAEMLWQLYAATSNYLNRSVDDRRFHAAGEGAVEADRIIPFLPASATPSELRIFLEGLPRRYLAAHSPEKIIEHFQMVRELPRQPVQVSLEARGPLFELSVVTADRPFLFASITGTLAAWGMNIAKAEAFSNTSGVVLDTFRFVDLFRTLELNPSEAGPLKKNLADVLSGALDLHALMSGRVNPKTLPRAKVTIATEVRFDDVSSSHSTLLELITQDRPGLLYHVSSTLARLACNIEVALIDTEGQKAIDVFYLTTQGRKLDPTKQQEIRRALLERP